MDEIIVINKDQLQEIVSEALRTTLNELGLSQDSNTTRFYTKKQVLELWNISKSTLWRLEKLGHVKGLSIGNKRYYEKKTIDNFDIGKIKRKKSA